MSLRFIRRALLALLASWQFAWADPAPVAQTPPYSLEQLAQAPARGLLYAARKGDQTAYLFGTIHLGRAEFYPLDLATTQALAQASELAVELDATDAARMRDALLKYAFLPPGQTLAATLPAELHQRLGAQADALGLAAAELQPLKPWMAALSLLTGLVRAMGYDAGYATDFYLIELARALDKPITELESADEQFALFDRLPREDQLVFLDESLRLFENGQAAGDLESLIAAWLAGNAATLHELALKSLRDSPRSAAWMERVLVTERNLHMAERIEQLTARGRTPFVAVGVLHLTGETGLPALLAARGYAVTPLHPGKPKETP
jgi:hypothetical protein